MKTYTDKKDIEVVLKGIASSYNGEKHNEWFCIISSFCEDEYSRFSIIPTSGHLKTTGGFKYTDGVFNFSDANWCSPKGYEGYKISVDNVSKITYDKDENPRLHGQIMIYLKDIENWASVEIGIDVGSHLSNLNKYLKDNGKY